jgi:hypothetical protein
VLQSPVLAFCFCRTTRWKAWVGVTCPVNAIGCDVSPLVEEALTVRSAATSS